MASWALFVAFGHRSADIWSFQGETCESCGRHLHQDTQRQPVQHLKPLSVTSSKPNLIPVGKCSGVAIPSICLPFRADVEAGGGLLALPCRRGAVGCMLQDFE